MKRAVPVSPKYVFYAIFPLFFWTYCFGCKSQFRREWGWETRIRAGVSELFPEGEKRFICKECAPTAEEACIKMDSQILSEKPKQPLLPPSPPSTSEDCVRG